MIAVLQDKNKLWDEREIKLERVNVHYLLCFLSKQYKNGSMYSAGP